MTKFSDLNLNPKVLKAVVEAGYTEPTPIQAGAIPPALEGRDVLGIAQTGTGKTASFTLPMITVLARGRARARMPRSLVLCPTRELAAQVAENFDTYSKHVNLTKALLIGGVSFKEQDKLIDKGVDVLIATPGRLLDHFERGKLILSDVKVMVVDEADRMLDMGFIPDIERIFGLTPFTRQTLFFSATMAPEIERITNMFLSNPERIEVARQATASDTILQGLVEFQPTRRDQTAKQKREMLRAVITGEGEKLTNAIIFCNRKVDVDVVAKSLKKHGLNAEPIHGDLDQSHRTRTLDGFRDGSIKFLVASDVAARGLDIPNVSHVLNYDVPSHAEDYVHRIGRTGRAGRKGTTIMLAVPSDGKYLSAIEDLIGQPVPRIEAPWSPGGSGTSPAKPEQDEERPARKSRSRSRSKPKEPEAEETPAEAKTPEQPAEKPKEAPRRSSRGSSRGGGGGGSRGQVVGLGDHLPDFIALSFDERRGRPVTPDTDEDETVEIDVEETPEAAAEEKPKPKRKSRAKKPKETPEAEAPAEEPSEAENDNESAA
ncbi:DEAD/DEAH box helicase [Alterinioella nitratireducens]|uniref:DEAD/DEAH box helicase n=1 Tax=Alterinioella nitratireducens TaxID=2735915 RepID=UPI00405974F3